MADRLRCDLCDDAIPTHGHYVVRMDVFADPSLPPIDTKELSETNYHATMQDLLKQIEGMTAEDLHDQVLRRFEYRVCSACQKLLIANPLGRPRQRQPHSN